ncbi:MAG TPA: gliding motility protein [Desulfobacterales bacterium]|nr:gliding motility protein [Desulfobacterales bacterium]
MAFINNKTKEIQVKIVYYGPGMGGKTTNLEFIHHKFQDRIDSDMVCIRTHGDRTLFFDFLPFEIGNIMGFNVRIQIYTVPGQVSYNATRRLVLKGADGIVFVADSTATRREKNILSLQNLQKNLELYKKSIFKTPLVMQYNKRDVKDIPLLPYKTMENELNAQLKAPSFEASALNGVNVSATLKKIISRTMHSMENMIKK